MTPGLASFGLVSPGQCSFSRVALGARRRPAGSGIADVRAVAFFWYRHFGVERSAMAVAHPQVAWSALRGLVGAPSNPLAGGGDQTGLPADFLIDAGESSSAATMVGTPTISGRWPKCSLGPEARWAQVDCRSRIR
jgi:hypothetical protein